MLRAVKHIRRLIGIVVTLGRHDALFIFAWVPQVAGPARWLAKVPGFRPRAQLAGQRPGQRLAAALESLGPGFIKFGQALSTRSDLLGAEMAADLSSLQDRLPPFSGSEARQLIEQELGAPFDDLFEAFEEDATAAASIAQVHYAVLKAPAPTEDTIEADEISAAVQDGSAAAEDPAKDPELPASREVAVKVLRPGIEAAFARDIELFQWLAELAERFVPKLRRLRPVESVETFAETVQTEMDLRLEAAAAEELRENFSDVDYYRVPKVHWSHTSRRVMTAERIAGIPAGDLAAIEAAGIEPTEIVAHAAEVFFRQVFEFGFFHADMHPGNLFVADDGTLIAVDFGIVGRVDKRTQSYLADMLIGFLSRDYEAVADVHFKAGYVPGHKDRGAFVQALRSIGDPILEQPTNEISIARLLAQLFHVTERFDMKAQPQLLLLQKTMFLAEGVGRALAPQTNMWFLARPLVENWMWTHRGPEARVRQAVEDAYEALTLIPAALRRLADEPPAPEINPPPMVWPLWVAIGLLALGLLVS